MGVDKKTTLATVCTLALLFFFHYKKSRGIRKHLVEADQQHPVAD